MSAAAVIRIECASIDFASESVIAGTIFDGKRFFRTAADKNAPDICNQ